MNLRVLDGAGDDIRRHENGKARRGTPTDRRTKDSVEDAPQRVNMVRDCVLAAFAISGRIVPHPSLGLVSVAVWSVLLMTGMP